MTNELANEIASTLIKEQISRNNLNDEEKKVYDSLVDTFENMQNEINNDGVNMYKIGCAIMQYIVAKQSINRVTGH